MSRAAGIRVVLYQRPLTPTLPLFPNGSKYDSLHPTRRFAAWEDRMSAAVKITRTDHLPVELRRLAANGDDAAQTRRLLAIAMVLEETSRLDAARQTGMDRQTLRDWVVRYNERGVDGLASRKPPGAAPKLSAAQMSELRDLVLAGPDPKADKVVRWRCVDLREEVTQRFCVTVPERTIAKWLRKLKLTRLQPRPFHPKMDAAAQEAFKKTLVSC
jgi:transposase